MNEVIDYPEAKDRFILSFKNEDTQFCDDLISLWKNSDFKSPGKTLKIINGNGVVDIDKSAKESIDAGFQINNCPLEIKNYCVILQECLNLYIKEFPVCDWYSPYGVIEPIVIQYYPPGGGYKKWHTERASNEKQTTTRHLVFMTYLNDVEDGDEYQGGTEWYHGNIKLNARKGNTVIWPSDWTHTHRGIVSPNKEKYIITGWFNFIKK
jgi:hypothetical protein